MMKYLNSLFILIAFALSGCGNSEEDITSIDDPELVTIAFFDALYNQKNVEKAASVCAPKLARIVKHYKSPSAVGRHLFNMSYDKVEISPDDSGVKVREQFKDKAIIIVFFDGTYNGQIYKDVKKISLVQIDDKWVIDKILKDPF